MADDWGPKAIVQEIRKWQPNADADVRYIEPGSPWDAALCQEREMPNLFIRKYSVDRLIPSRAAAPRLPETSHFV
jgi:hypothetical protein